MNRTLLAGLAIAVCASCAGRFHATPEPAPPAFLLGSFVDDYGSRYEITATDWVQGTRSRFHIVRWNVTGQYAIARNDANNPSDGGLWTRIDWLELPGMMPYRWGYCYSAFGAPSAAVADTVSIAQRSTPRTGCNGFPFSRMRAAPP